MKGEVDARWGRAVDVYVIRCPMHRFIREEGVSTKRLLQPKNNNIPITHRRSKMAASRYYSRFKSWKGKREQNSWAPLGELQVHRILGFSVRSRGTGCIVLPLGDVLSSSTICEILERQSI